MPRRVGERRGDLVDLAREQARRRSAARARAGSVRGELEQQRAQQVREHDRRCPARRGQPARAAARGAGRSARTSISTPLTAAFSRGRLRRSRARCRAPSTGAKPSSAAAIASTPEPVPTSSSGAGARLARRPARAAAPGTGAWSRARRCRTPARGRSRSRAARRARRALGGLPRRAHVQRRDRRGARRRCGRGVDQAPGGGTASSAHASRRRSRSWRSRPARRRRRASQVGQRGQLARARRRRRTRPCPPRARTSSTPAGASSSSSASTSSACSRGDADGEPDHAAWLPSARRSLANTDSCERRFSSVRLSFRRSISSRCSALRRRGTIDVDDHAQVAAAPAAQRRHALAAQRQHLARLRAGGQLDRRGALERRHLERRRRAPPAARRTSSAVIRSSPSRTKRSSRAHATSTYRSPAGAPASPAWPRPLSADALPVGDAGGHVDLERAPGRHAARGRGTRGRAASATRPSPWQTSQTTVRTICPNGVRVTACSCPAPPQRSQVSIGVPGSAPLPWQCSQRSTAS